MEAARLEQSAPTHETQTPPRRAAAPAAIGVQGAPGIMAVARFAEWVKRLPAERGQGNRGIGGPELYDTVAPPAQQCRGRCNSSL